MEFVRLTRHGRVHVLTIDRPPVNAFTVQVYREVGEALAAASADTASGCIVITAAGDRAFSAGLDLKEMARNTEAERDERARLWRELLHQVYECPKVTIAAINGAALGAGAGLATVCDLRVAAAEASFGLPEIKVGLAGGASHLRRLLPEGKVREMVFTGEPISARDALAFGLVERVVPRAELLPAVIALGEQIAQRSNAVLALTKECLNRGEFLDMHASYALEQTYTETFRRMREAVAAMTGFGRRSDADG